MNLSEKIICAAIWFDDGKEYPYQPKNIVTGFVLCGLRHGNCFGPLVVFDHRNADYAKNEQGFLTSYNRFVSRTEAYEIAVREVQIVNNPTQHGILFSEDLY